MTTFTVCWLIAMVVFCIIESATATLTTIWMAIAALITAGISIFNGSVLTQLLSFALISAALVLVTRPLAKKFLDGKIVPTNADRIINAKGIVVKEILTEDDIGQIKVMGQLWSAKAIDKEPLEKGEEIVVLSIEGVCAIVEKARTLQKV